MRDESDEMGDLLQLVENWIAWAFLGLVAILGGVEPDSRVWVMAGFGSFGSVLWGPPRGLVYSICYWIVGIAFAVSWTIGIDHFNPVSEAFFVGLGSAAATKIWLRRFSVWAGGVLSTGMTGGSKRGT